jgi:uncharacterized cupredoxin-like copper-binding protein
MKECFSTIKHVPLTGWLLASLLVLLVACGGATASTSSTGGSSSGPQVVQVTEDDFSIQAAQTQFVSGQPYQFVVTNRGSHHHDFLIMHPMTTETMVMDDVYKHALAYLYNIAPGQTRTLDFTFDHTAPAGMLEFSCHYGGHYEAGMHQAIVVTAPAGASVTPYANNAIPTNADTPTSAAGATTGQCDAPITVKIGPNETYTQSSVSLKQGDILTIVNTTRQSFTLTTTPAAGIPFTTVDPGETQAVPFAHAGSFSVSSQEHPQARLTVQVAATTGVTCGYTPIATVSFDASYTSPTRPYFFTPTSLTLKAGQSITLSNLSDNNLTFISTPDANLGNITLDRNEHQLLLFANPGTYTISCVQFPKEHFTVTVQKNG